MCINISKDHPANSELRDYFKMVYAPVAGDECIDNLHTNLYITVTDDTISMNELLESSLQMKEGGFDYPVTVLSLVCRLQSYVF